MRAKASRLYWLVYPIALAGFVLWGLGLFDTGFVSHGAEVAGWIMALGSMAALAVIGVLTRRRFPS